MLYFLPSWSCITGLYGSQGGTGGQRIVKLDHWKHLTAGSCFTYTYSEACRVVAVTWVHFDNLHENLSIKKNRSLERCIRKVINEKKSAKSKCLQLPRKISTIKRKLKYFFFIVISNIICIISLFPFFCCNICYISFVCLWPFRNFSTNNMP